MAAPLEKKVTWSTLGGFLIGLAVTLLNNLQADAELMGNLPSWLQGIITLFAPPLVIFLMGYRAPHTRRPDLGEADNVRVPPAI